MKSSKRSGGARVICAALAIFVTAFALISAGARRRGSATFKETDSYRPDASPSGLHRRELSSEEKRRELLYPPGQAGRARQQKVLVVYLLYDSHKDPHQANFEFFRRTGLVHTDGSTYLVLGQALEGEVLGSLPANTQFIQMEQQCAWGMLNELFISNVIDVEAFDAMVVASSFVRGPFLPPGLQGYIAWTDAFVSKLIGSTRLVSTMLSCEGVHGIGPNHVDGEHSFAPHISWHAFALDQAGLQLLRSMDSVLTCYDEDLIHNGAYQAVLASLAVLQAGYNLDSLMLRYQGVDWRNAANWDCNERMAPGLEHTYDGLSLHPLEVMFVPVDERQLKSSSSSAVAAKRYDQWAVQQEAGNLNVSENRYALDPTPFRTERIAYMRERGPGCFDSVYYKSNSPDLASIEQQQLWEHFVLNGQFEDRIYRFSCLDLKARGSGCFDDAFYNTENADLNERRVAGIGFTATQSWDHFLKQGRNEGRHYRFKTVCVEDLDSPNTL